MSTVIDVVLRVVLFVLVIVVRIFVFADSEGWDMSEKLVHSIANACGVPILLMIALYAIISGVHSVLALINSRGNPGFYFGIIDDSEKIVFGFAYKVAKDSGRLAYHLGKTSGALVFGSDGRGIEAVGDVTQKRLT